MNNNIRHKIVPLELVKPSVRKKKLKEKLMSDEEKKLLDLISHIIFENIIKQST